MLEVVEDEQQLPRAEPVAELGLVLEPESAGDCRPYEPRLLYRCEQHEHGLLPELGDRKGQPRLPDPTWAHECQQPYIGAAEQCPKLRHLLQPADERCQGGRHRPGLPYAARRSERCVLNEDLALQALKLGARIDPELVHEQLTSLSIHSEGVRLSPEPVKRQHQLGAQPLPQRVGLGESLELGNELRLPPQLKVRIDPVLDRRLPQLLEPHQLPGKPKLVGDVGEGRAAPDRERLDKQ